MSSSAASQCLLRLSRAPVIQKPWPHIYVRDIFPAAYYREILANLPPDDAYGEAKYPNRAVCDTSKLDSAFWQDLNDWMGQISFITKLVRHLIPHPPSDVRYNIRLVRDTPEYSLAPHTDLPQKLLSFLFYLPQDEQMKPFGTTIFRHQDPNFRSDGMEWLDPTGFSPQWTAPFMPNTCFAFHRTDQSFHGVLPHDNLGVRNVLLLNVFRKVDADHREVQAA